ncbi:hypothetical protein [Xylanimonas sp. McL0601]|uniref:hypothetical protein n=1 Tax=Xylanimonas sp. McL0601 TaxID=3414739 RepID=UPI003CF16E80
MSEREPESEQDVEPRRQHRRVVRVGTEREPVSGVTEDERGGHGDNDDRLLGDVPPHWGRR